MSDNIIIPKGSLVAVTKELVDFLVSLPVYTGPSKKEEAAFFDALLLGYLTGQTLGSGETKVVEGVLLKIKPEYYKRVVWDGFNTPLSRKDYLDTSKKIGESFSKTTFKKYSERVQEVIDNSFFTKKDYRLTRAEIKRLKSQNPDSGWKLLTFKRDSGATFLVQRSLEGDWNALKYLSD